jgi:hypothetical protein
LNVPHNNYKAIEYMVTVCIMNNLEKLAFGQPTNGILTSMKGFAEDVFMNQNQKLRA